MKDDNMVVTTTKESIVSIAQLDDCINELGNILVHMVKNTRDEWTSGCSYTRVNEE
jgi:hypothetical protein